MIILYVIICLYDYDDYMWNPNTCDSECKIVLDIEIVHASSSCLVN